MTRNAFDLGLELQRVARVGPDRLALSDSQCELTYGELLTESRGLAASLPRVHGEVRQPVALIMPQGARAIVAQVACLVAGRPYCALAPAQPRQRLEALLSQIEPERIWVTDERRRQQLEAVGLPAAEPVAVAGQGDRNGHPGARSAGAGLLCAVYVTSGSSGAPKLVGYRHEAVRHRVRSYSAALDAGPDDRFSLASPLWTAAAASAIFTALLSGASLHVLDPAGSGPKALQERVRASRATVWHSTPSLFRRLGGAGLLDDNRFRFVRLTGERLLAGDVELAKRICDGEASLITAYSLTEANGVVTQKVVPLSDAGPRTGLDSGRPLDGIDVSIESDGRSLGTGEEGEIVVGGKFLSAGYLDSDERRAGTRFADRGGAPVLHTGDRGVLHEDGSLEVRGRDDRRLKIHGQRVDPTEVEAAALRHDGVLDAVLVPFTPAAGGTAAALFAASDPGAGPATHRSLQAHIGELVAPEAMPALVRVIETLPRTPAGKVDRVRLARFAESGDRRPAQRPGENGDPLVDHMVRLWKEALEIDEAALDDDFFAAGGDSLASAEVCAAVETTYGVSLQPAALLEHRSPAALAEHVRGILDGAPQVSPNVVTFNPSGGEPPLFVVPGAGSDATALVHFADAVGADQPVKVIQLPGADGRSKPVTRMDRITAHCVEAIRQSSVPPPYRIAGTSFGGLVAYDVGSELLGDGDEVAYLGLFDTPAPMLRRGHFLTRPLRRFSFPPHVSVRGAIRQPRRELRRMRAPLRRLLADYRVVVSVLLGLHRPSAELRFRYLRTGCSMAADRWTPPPIPAPLHLYRCDSQPAHLAGAPRLGWDGLAPRIDVRGLPARHNRHIRPPSVSHLAALVNDDLRVSKSTEHSPSAGPPPLANS